MMTQREENKIAVRMQGVSKEYTLGVIGGKTLQDDLQSFWAKKRGRQDPNRRIGIDERLYGKKFLALDGIDLTIYKGERIGIIGANGAGKSTLLKILSRITAPTAGEVDIYGRVSSMLEIGTGFHRELTGRENIYMNGSILGMKKDEIDTKLEDIIDFSEIREFIDTPVKRYSSGMFVKLAFSVAAHLNSEILIMDEVLAVGDMAFQQKCLDRMRQAADDEGRTVLYVSHNMNTIRSLCSRCIVLDAGRIIFDGETESAIAVYMNHCLGDNNVDIDLEKMPRNSRGIEPKIMMKRLVLEGKAEPLYEPGEHLRLKLWLDVQQPVDDLYLRLTLRTDSDSGLGTAWAGPLNLSGSGDQITLADFDLNAVAKGIFYASIGLGTKDEIGRYRSIDHITRAFRFEVKGRASWNTNVFGYMNYEMVWQILENLQ